ncbi:restriction endonuclease subunit S, partial [Parvibaculum sp.]|uniref:restriction endonuclease subunit S n=1 Tax=Parvibaculum sp. TaxID=2024848 RepID=UPI0038B27FD7
MSEMFPLGSVVNVSSGQPALKANEFAEDGKPFIRAGSLENLLNGGSLLDCEKISDDTAEKKRLRLYPKDTIVFAKSGMSATLGRVYRLSEPAYVVSHLAALVPTGRYDPVFLTYWLRENPPSRLIKDPAYPSIRVGEIRNLNVPDVSLKEQRRIAMILDKADGVRRKREQALEMANELLQAAFLEMFGDPVGNRRGFRVGTIRDLLEEVRYGTAKKASESEGEFPVLRMGNITYSGSLDVGDLKYVDLNESEKQKYILNNGDILFNRTNSSDLVGKTAVFDLDGDFTYAGYLVRGRVNDKVADPYFISGYLNSRHGKSVLRAMCKSIIGMANINAQEFQNIKIMMPPLSLQKKYRQIVEGVSGHKILLSRQLTESGQMFSTLSAR